MTYTSGRTVKSAKRHQPTTVASATREARNLVARNLPNVQGVTIESRLSAAQVTLVPQVVTVVTFPAGTDASQLVVDATCLPGYVDAIYSSSRIAIIRIA